VGVHICPPLEFLLSPDVCAQLCIDGSQAAAYALRQHIKPIRLKVAEAMY
jgi:hypothetical protein